MDLLAKINPQRVIKKPKQQANEMIEIEPNTERVLIPYQPLNKELGENYNSFVAKDGNIIWAAALNLAFDDFKKTFLSNKPLQFKNKQTISSKGIRSLKTLNNAIFKAKDIIQSSIYIKSGYGNPTVKVINEEILKKFPHKKQNPLDIDISDDAFLSYAFLFKALQYKHEFQRLPGMLWFGNRKQYNRKQPIMVEAFSAVSSDCLQQIKIISYEGPNEFFIGFKAKQQSEQDKNQRMKQAKKQKSKGFIGRIIQYLTSFYDYFHDFWSKNQYTLSPDVIYIISSQNQLTVDKVIEKVKQAQKTKIDERQSNPNLVQFIMPVIDLDLNHQYQEFTGLQIQNSALEGRRLKMIQNIKLRMDQKGVVIQNDAFIGKDECAIIGNIEILINRDFWLVLTEESKHPYFVAKINNLPQKNFKNSFQSSMKDKLQKQN